MLLLAASDVRGDEELQEQHQQGHNVAKVSLGQVQRVGVTAVVDKVPCLGIHEHKLDHLGHGEGTLPPDIVGVQGHKVVGVHDGVDQTVQYNSEVDVSIVTNVNVQPVELRYSTVRYRKQQGGLCEVIVA